MRQYVCSDILNNKYINNYNYIAHTKNNKKSETLKEHLDNVLNTALYIYDVYDVDSVLDNFIDKINPEWNEVIKELFFSVIYLHDFGKINPMFQAKIGNSSSEILDISIPEHLKGDSGHSVISLIMFVDYFFDKYEYLESDILDSMIVKFSMNILKHHSSYLDTFHTSDIESRLNKFEDAYDILTSIGYVFKTDNFIFSDLDNYIKAMNNYSDSDETLFHLLKLNYGLLTKSDYIATTNYMNGYKHKESIVNQNDIKNKFWINDKFKDGSNNFNSKIDLNNLSEPSNNRSNVDLNILRSQMLSEAMVNLKKNKDKNVFFLECPTGGGKTNISFSIIDFMVNNFNVKKVFYVFPFNKLSEQTKESFINTFHLDNDKVVSLSYDSYKELENISDQEGKSVYSTDTINMMNNTFMNFPYLLMSNIRFFDILKSNSKKSMYNLHTLSNSVVIIDEIQAYNPTMWSKLVYFIDNYASLFNIKFIIMSATLPKIDSLLKDDKKFVNLITNRDKYFLNNNFKGRVKFDGRYLNEKMTFERLKDLVIDISEKYYQNNDTSYTIVEFIYKKSASQFVNEYSDYFAKLGYEVMLLSSVTLKSRSHRIIKDIKDKKHKKVILVCTQTIEAGVDIDMDNGFKDTSVIDSEEQLAGRINRNASKKGNVLYLVNFRNKFIYKSDPRFGVFKYDDKYIQVLNNKDFKSVYEKIMLKMKNSDNTNMEKSLNIYMNYIKELNFKKVSDEMELIEKGGESISIFIPKNLPIKDVLLTFGNISKIKKFVVDGYLIGEKVWYEYDNLVTNKKFLQIKKMQNIISLFTVNMLMSKTVYKNLSPYLDKDERIIRKLINDSIYDYNLGFNSFIYEKEDGLV